jgi:hypothetical protein
MCRTTTRAGLENAMNITPGLRWRIEADGHRILVDGKHYQLIAHVEDAFDAPLVAAAPQMLDALEAAEGVLDWAIDNGAHPGALAVWRFVKKAIDAAKKNPS